MLHLTDLLQAVHLIDNDSLLSSPFAVIAGLTYNFLPFMILPLYASLSGWTLGCSRPPETSTPTVQGSARSRPLSLPGVVAGTLLTFIPAAGDYINARLLGNTQTTMSGRSSTASSSGCSTTRPRPPCPYHADVDRDDRDCTSARRERRNWCVMAWLASPRPDPGIPLAILVFLYMLVPNMVVVVFSFNLPKGQVQLNWKRVLDRGLGQPVRRPGHLRVAGAEPEDRAVVAIGATILGTAIAFALGRYRFRGRSATNLLIFMPMATPEVVMGSSLLTLFLGLGVPAGRRRSDRAHHVLPVVRRRRGQGPGRGLDPRFEQAAVDLDANPTRPSSGSLCRSWPRASRPVLCWRSRSGSTTTSSRTSTRARARSRSRCSSGARRPAAPRCRSTYRHGDVRLALLFVVTGQVLQNRRARAAA